MVLHARQVTGADTEIRCNSQGRLETVISENITCAIQAANIGAGANIALRCSDTGRLLVHPPDQAAFDTIVVLKDNEAIAPGYYQFASGEGRRGLRVTILVKHETGSTAWTANIDQSIDNVNWITTNEDINSMPLGIQMLEFITIAPYWRIVLNNTGIHSNFTIKYI